MFQPAANLMTHIIPDIERIIGTHAGRFVGVDALRRIVQHLDSVILLGVDVNIFLSGPILEGKLIETAAAFGRIGLRARLRLVGR